MNTIVSETSAIRVMSPGELTELVRGTDHILLALLAPMVQQYNVALDLTRIRRIDAAGIAALISLYSCALESGHTFCAFNVAPRIDDILRLVGLESLLVSHDAIQAMACEGCREQTAA